MKHKRWQSNSSKFSLVEILMGLALLVTISRAVALTIERINRPDSVGIVVLMLLCAFALTSALLLFGLRKRKFMRRIYEVSALDRSSAVAVSPVTRREVHKLFAIENHPNRDGAHVVLWKKGHAELRDLANPQVRFPALEYSKIERVMAYSNENAELISGPLRIWRSGRRSSIQIYLVDKNDLSVTPWKIRDQQSFLKNVQQPSPQG